MIRTPYSNTLDYQGALVKDLHAQLCCAWEEIAEQHHEADESLPRVWRESKSVIFKDNHIVVVGHDGSLNHFKFILERVS